MSYTFSSTEQAQLQAAISASTGLTWDGIRYSGIPVAGTNAVPLYQTLSSLIAQKLATPSSFDQATLKELQNAKLWLDVAAHAVRGLAHHESRIRPSDGR